MNFMVQVEGGPTVKATVFPVIVATVLVGTAGAQDQGPDSIGLYWDNPPNHCYQMSCLDGGQPGLGVAYLVIAGPTAASVGGLEIAIALGPGPSEILGTTFVVDAVDNDASPGGIDVVFGEPVLPSGYCNMVLLGELSLLALAVPTEFYAGPNEPATLPGYAVYFDGENLENAIPLSFRHVDDELIGDDGWTVVPWAQYGGVCATPIEKTAWSAVKGLYR